MPGVITKLISLCKRISHCYYNLEISVYYTIADCAQSNFSELAAPSLDPSLYLALRARPWLRISQSYDVDMSDVDTTLMLFAAATACTTTESWQ